MYKILYNEENIFMPLIAFLLFIAVVGFALSTAIAMTSITLSYLLIWIFPLTLFQAALLIILAGFGLMGAIIAATVSGLGFNPYIENYDDVDDEYPVIITQKKRKNKSKGH